jgi:hypothetical protein
MSLTGILGGISAVGSAAGGIGSLINSFGGGGGGASQRQNDLIRDSAEAAAQNAKITAAQLVLFLVPLGSKQVNFPLAN